MKREYDKTTSYRGIAGIYFRALIKTIINIGHLGRPDLRILDFGSGYGNIKRILSSSKGTTVINYDIVPTLTDVSDWQEVTFDVMVANQVFYLFERKELISLLNELKAHNPELELIVGISRQSFFNNLGKILLRQSDAHNDTKMSPKDELATLRSLMIEIDRKSVFLLSDVYRLKFK